MHIYASDRGPPDVNLHRNDCVCDPCRERWPELKGTFSQLRPTGHVKTSEVVAPTNVVPTDVVPNAQPTDVANPPQLDDPPEAVEGPANIAPLDTIDLALSKPHVCRCSDCSACLQGVKPDGCMLVDRAPTTHKRPTVPRYDEEGTQMMTFDDIVSDPKPDCTGKLVPYAPAVNTHDASDFDNLPDGVQFDCSMLPHSNARIFCIRFKCPQPECAKDSDADVTLSLFKEELNLYPRSKQPLYGRRHSCRNLRVKCWQEQKTLIHAPKPGVNPSTQADPKQAPKVAST